MYEIGVPVKCRLKKKKNNSKRRADLSEEVKSAGKQTRGASQENTTSAVPHQYGEQKQRASLLFSVQEFKAWGKTGA